MLQQKMKERKKKKKNKSKARDGGNKDEKLTLWGLGFKEEDEVRVGKWEIKITKITKFLE